ncbi:MAG: carbohydrate kinase family protein [Gemmatimonadota bacterium]|nr:carbohydrate kinase family protein [Gemmatimonadota bacterium]
MGSPSVDLLHFRGRSERSAGGAGLYTALAARRAGADVTMVAPRPDPMPPELVAPAALLRWRGPTVAADALPHFEIAHEPGGRTTYIRGVWGSEGHLSADDVPRDLQPGLAYVVPMMDSTRQVEIALRLKEEGWSVGCGTYGGATRKHRDVVLRSIELADVFFCNENEAHALFGDVESASTEPGKLLFITRGERGARVVQGAHATDVQGVAVEELDPTGAGDTFCGTTLAFLSRGAHPVIAARHAVAAAAEMVTGVGPETLLREGTSPTPTADPRLRVDPERCEAVARVIATAPEATAFDFTGPDYPEPGHPVALDFFFAATLQQFGFWTEEGGAYRRPMIAALDGRELKGSDFLWAAYRRWLDDAPLELSPGGQAEIAATFDARLRADDGVNPLPAGPLHPAAAVAYGRDMTALGWTPTSVVDSAAAADRPVEALLRMLDHVGGYKEDPLRKKSALLAAILSQRPEGWIEPGSGEDVPPIVDYHCLRSCLRLGLVTVEEPELAERLETRRVVDGLDEDAIRGACSEAVALVHRMSGRTMGAVDWFFFQNRHRCPEMSAPDCPGCPADGVCAHLTELFQPVFRTTAY